MNAVPLNVDFRTSAAASAAKARFAPPAFWTRDSLDVATALKCMTVYQTMVSDADLETFDDEDVAAPLVAAARTLQSTAQHLRRSGNPEVAGDADELHFFAAIAFAMHGNFPSAAAALSEVSSAYISQSPTFLMAAAVCEPSRSRASITGGLGSPYEPFREAWFLSFTQRSPAVRGEQFLLAVQGLMRTAMNGSPLDIALALNVRVAAHQAKRLAVASLVDRDTAIPEWFIGNAIDAGYFTLLPPQLVLLADERIAAHNRNTLLTLPTSTGKTLIAQACIAAGSGGGGLFVYVAPYVAIGEQVRQSLAATFRSQVPVVSMFGGFKAEQVNAFQQTEVLVATPERFDAWLRAGQGLERLRLVVFDEIHILENGGRGARVEGMISRLRLLQRTHPRIRLLGLSAVLAEPEGVCRWLGVANEDAHKIGWRPTARRLAMCMSNGDMHWVHGNDPLRPDGLSADASISQPVRVNLPGTLSLSGYTTGNEKGAAQNVAAIARDFSARLGFPGLVVCNRKVDTRLLASVLMQAFQPLGVDEVSQVAAGIVTRHPWLKFLSECLLRGVAYHNAALPFDVRRGIETLTRKRLVRVVCATTTLAEGADLPFRWTVVAHWLMSMRDQGTPMKSMTFRNIAGRCGRAGAFSEGDTVLFENLLGPPARNRYTRLPTPNRLTQVMFSSSPLESTVGPGWADTPANTKQLLEAAFASQLLACIGEQPNLDNLVDELVASSYAAKCGGGATLRGILSATLASTLDTTLPGGAMAVANSPVRLTEFGRAANRTGFAPDSCRFMVTFLGHQQFQQGPAFFAGLLRRFHHLAEQPSDDLRKILSGARHRNIVKDENLELLFSGLLAGLDVRAVFESLRDPKSKAKPDSVETSFEKFVSFVDSVVLNFLPWLLRGLEALKPYGSPQAAAIDWSSAATVIERSLGARAESDLDLDEPEAD